MDGLSIIIPIYNVEDYIEACLQSVMGSMGDYVNVQIILVDDGSTDRSTAIARKFVEQCSCFQLVHKENGGLADARNYGLHFAAYDYVSFIDSDDCLSADYFIEVMNALKSGPDLVIFDWLTFGGNVQESLIRGMDHPEFLWTVQPNAWNKIYKKSLFADVLFPKGKIYEDVGTTYKLLYHVKNFVYIDKALYRYRQNRPGSILATISPKIEDIYDVLADTYSFYKGKEEFHLEGLCYQYVKLLMWSNMHRQLKFYKYNFIGFYQKMRRTRILLYHKFPNWQENKFLHLNSDYFEGRLGVHFIEKFDGLGKSFFGTILIVMALIIKNFKRFQGE